MPEITFLMTAECAVLIVLKMFRIMLKLTTTILRGPRCDSVCRNSHRIAANTVLKQVGVTEAVGVLPRKLMDWRQVTIDHPWDYTPLAIYKEMVEEEGLTLSAIEDSPPMDLLDSVPQVPKRNSSRFASSRRIWENSACAFGATIGQLHSGMGFNTTVNGLREA